MADRNLAVGVALALALGVAALLIALIQCMPKPAAEAPQPQKPKIVLVPVDFVLQSPRWASWCLHSRRWRRGTTWLGLCL